MDTEANALKVSEALNGKRFAGLPITVTRTAVSRLPSLIALVHFTVPLRFFSSRYLCGCHRWF
jgi:hypothetical protein